ncbi:MAG TPA: Hsp20/alpha crystallin family protein, partial [Gemmatimonadales bacterium]|nr:Hsp20/alpha crystallin family protein [Gemmatimonadales bacterium]
MYFTTSTRVPATVRTPFNGIRQINRLLDEAISNFGDGTDNGGTLASAWVPACDVFEGREMLKIVMEVPGVVAEDVKLSLENNQLSIRGEKRQAAEEQTERVHRYERSYGSFERV